MTTEHSTYTYEDGARETVMLTHGPTTPRGHALLTIDYSDGPTVACYVNTAWLRDRLNDLGEPRRLTPDAITGEMVDRAHRSLIGHHGYGRILRSQVCEALTAALTEPPARPEGAERFDPVVDAAIRGYSDITSPDVVRAISDAIAEDLTDPTRKEA